MLGEKASDARLYLGKLQSRGVAKEGDSQIIFYQNCAGDW